MVLSLLARFSTVGEAECALSALDAAGIDAVLADEEIVALYWTYSNAVGGIKLLVADAQMDEAALVLAGEATGVVENTVDAGSATVADEQQDHQTSPIDCPSCGSTDVAPVPRAQLFLFFTVVALGLGYAVRQPGMAFAVVGMLAVISVLVPALRCIACGERWSAKAPMPEAPLPLPADTVEKPCPRCGAPEIHHILYRRLRVIPLFLGFTIILIMPVWLLLPKWECDRCGLQLWLPNH